MLKSKIRPTGVGAIVAGLVLLAYTFTLCE